MRDLSTSFGALPRLARLLLEARHRVAVLARAASLSAISRIERDVERVLQRLGLLQHVFGCVRVSHPAAEPQKPSVADLEQRPRALRAGEVGEHSGVFAAIYDRRIEPREPQVR
jgi:hypothetical protein